MREALLLLFSVRSLFVDSFRVQNVMKCMIYSRYISISAEKEEFQRLERILSNRGVGSRTEVSKLIKQGRVLIDGEVVRNGATKFPKSITVQVDDIDIVGVPLLALYNKPKGIHSTMGDPWGRESLEELSLEYPYLKTMHPVVR